MSEQAKSKRFVAIQLEYWLWEAYESESRFLNLSTNEYLSQLLQTLGRVHRSELERVCE